jgi:hypothetical protein
VRLRSPDAIAYDVLFVFSGYELSEKRELVVEKKLRGVELGWALGAGIALVEKATLTCTA